MERLSGLDATFLHGETPSIHMHTLKVAIIEPAPGAGPDTFDHFRDELAKRLHLLPPFRRRVVDIPLGFHHPVWIEDPHFDINYHVRGIAIPAPGGRRQMDEVIADIASHSLDHRHPLWEIWRLEGLAEGGIVYVAKIHHSVADGVAAAHLLANVMSAHNDADEPTSSTDPWRPEPIPSTKTLLVNALRDHLRTLAELLPLIWKTFRGIGRLLRHRLRGGAPAAQPFDGPRTSLNRGLTPARSFATLSVPVAEVRAIKSALGVTLNDVVLAIVGGALRRFLELRGEESPRSLVATIPVAAPGADEEKRLAGNRLSNLFTSLCTDIDDPLERVQTIHDKMVIAKDNHERLGGSIMLEWAEYVPPRPYSWMVRLYARTGLAAKHRPPANAVVSNVRGPGERLYIAGARLRNLYSVGPIVEGIGINVTAWSYADELAFTVLACREAVPQAHEVTECLRWSLSELTRAVGEAQQSDPSDQPSVAHAGV
jgi:diacylglycerol O-acyltransferase